VYDAWHGYWHLARHGVAPAYPFGFGLSYTSFTLEKAEAALAGGELRVTVTVRNAGRRPGTDVVQVYASRRGSSRPSRLVGFARIELAAGRTATVDLAICAAGLAERDVASHSMVVRAGLYDLRVARHAADGGIALQVEIAGRTEP
jgi:beta-glucosidase